MINVPYPKKYQINPVCHTSLWISCFVGLKQNKHKLNFYPHWDIDAKSIGLNQNKHKLNFYPHLDIDAKSINADVSETDDQNNDIHSYLTISDRSDRLYAAVHYDEAEDTKSSSPLSLRSITEHVSSESENSKTSESYLTPVVEAVEHNGNSPRSSDYEDVTIYKMK